MAGDHEQGEEEEEGEDAGLADVILKMSRRIVFDRKFQDVKMFNTLYSVSNINLTARARSGQRA